MLGRNGSLVCSVTDAVEKKLVEDAPESVWRGGGGVVVGGGGWGGGAELSCLKVETLFASYVTGNAKGLCCILL